jgi:hypothetical protein
MADEMPEVILFEHRHFHGAHKHVFEPGEKDLNARDDKLMFDPARGVGKTSSIVVKGTKIWLFFTKQDHTPKPGLEVKPGRYPTTEDAHPGLKDNFIQSLQPKP